ncbi:MAG: prepilin-type N-terminal cleavage/methylation domain-containing protein [Nitrospirae bacterium]|nr:prepilin-type N-terminal cleavage/methylation domain-containing protein [Nitrospirota bacterium]
MRSNSNVENGVTLIELIVVVAIIGIIAGFATLGFDFVNRERLSSATKELVADIQQVRVDALTSGQTGTTGMGVGIRFMPTTSYTLFTWNDINLDFAYNGTGEEESVETRTISSRLSLQLNTIPGDPAYTVLVYNKTGVPMRYKADGSSIAGDMIITISDGTASNVKCISVTTNFIREGVLSGTNCIQ